jgi:hypothetical protein
LQNQLSTNKNVPFSRLSGAAEALTLPALGALMVIAFDDPHDIAPRMG